MSNIKALIIEDDRQIRDFVGFLLSKEDIEFYTASSGSEGYELFLKEGINLILLDLGLPDIDGIEIIKKIRKLSQATIIVVSARDQEKEKVLALNEGADDYLTKPFSSTELLARINVAIRHIKLLGEKAQIKETKGLQLDIEKHIVKVNGDEIHLTPLEFTLFEYLFSNIGKVLTTQNIIKEVYGYSYTNDTGALRTLMAGLRRKIEENPANPRYIKTEIGIGYRLVDD